PEALEKTLQERAADVLVGQLRSLRLPPNERLRVAPFMGQKHSRPEPTPLPGIHIVNGLTPDEVGRIIRRHWNALKFCYEKELGVYPDLDGSVILSFQISPTGDVTNAFVSQTTLENREALDCMVDLARGWKFPPPHGGGVVDVNYPLTF